jgi:5-methylthioadenosine/S-adenosylhomocysteine deaminase
MMQRVIFPALVGALLGPICGRGMGQSTAPPGRFLIKHAAMVVTMAPASGSGELGILDDADVLFERRILAVGRDIHDPSATPIDAHRKIVLPGFVDAHDHLWQSLIRGCASGATLLDWMLRCVLPVGVVIDDRAAYAGVRLSTIDVISTGITTVLDWSHAFRPSFVDGNLRALRDSGLRFVFCYYGAAQDVLTDDVRKTYDAYIVPNPLASLQICSDPKDPVGLAWSVHLAETMNVPLNVHLLESGGDALLPVIDVLELAGAFRSRLIVNHVVRASSRTVERLARHGVTASYNPLSNMRLGSGVMPVGEFAARGTKVGLGLDGGTNDTADMFANMKAAVGLQRAVSAKTEVYPSIAAVLRMATLGGAEALWMEHEIGSIEPGKRADLILIDPHRPNFIAGWDTLSEIVLNGQPRNVDSVFVEGHPLKRGGKLILQGTTEERIVADAESATAWLKSFAPLPQPIAPGNVRLLQ